MPGTLYLCATPIGNLEDITFRVLRTLREADLIAAEDTRHSIKLLNHFDIKTPMTSYHEYNKVEKAAYLVERLKEGLNIALITDAGTPGISDPGEELVRQCAAAGISVTSLPGPAACITALSMSGLPTRRFCFEAFLPSERSDKRERQRILEELKKETRTIILYEAPHHLLGTLRDLEEALGGERHVSLCRELTKRYESVLRATLEEAIASLSQEEPKGEWVIVLEGRHPEEIRREEIRLLLSRGPQVFFPHRIQVHGRPLRLSRKGSGIQGQAVRRSILLKLHAPDSLRHRNEPPVHGPRAAGQRTQIIDGNVMHRIPQIQVDGRAVRGIAVQRKRDLLKCPVRRPNRHSRFLPQ